MKEFSRAGQRFAIGDGQRQAVLRPQPVQVPPGRAGRALDVRPLPAPRAASPIELCVYKGCQAESIDHPTACYHMNTGNRFGGDPAIGAWTTYGLGTLNQNLPAFVVLPEGAFPQGGAANWSNGFLPAALPGHAAAPDRLADPRPQAAGGRHAARCSGPTSTCSRSSTPATCGTTRTTPTWPPAWRRTSWPSACRREVPGVVDLSGEDEATRAMYGIGQPGDRQLRPPLPAGAQARARTGVRFVQIFEGGWDSHDYLERSHAARIRSIDQPIAALIADLQAPRAARRDARRLVRRVRPLARQRRARRRTTSPAATTTPRR